MKTLSVITSLLNPIVWFSDPYGQGPVRLCLLESQLAAMRAKLPVLRNPWLKRPGRPRRHPRALPWHFVQWPFIYRKPKEIRLDRKQGCKFFHRESEPAKLGPVRRVWFQLFQGVGSFESHSLVPINREDVVADEHARRLIQQTVFSHWKDKDMHHGYWHLCDCHA